MFRTFITSHCSSLPQSLYDKTHTLQKEQLVYNFIPPPSARSMLFIRTWLRAAQEHNSTDPPVFDSEEIVDLKYQDSVTNSHINEHLHCYCYCYFAGYKILLSVLMRKFHSLTEKKSKSLSVGDCEWIFVLLDLLIWVKFLDPTKIPAHILSLSLFFSVTCPAFPLSHGVIGAELGGGLVGIKYYSQTYTFNTCAPNQVITAAPTDPDEIKAACGEEGEGREVSVCGGKGRRFT